MSTTNVSTKFNPRTTPRQKPPWCKPGLFPPIPPIIGGRVQYVIAYLAWKDQTAPDSPDLTTSLKLPWLDLHQNYHAKGTGDQHGLEGRVTPTGDQGFYTLEVSIWRKLGARETDEWTDVFLGIDLPWDSGLHYHQTIPGEDYQAIQIWA